ncbi:YesU family protein [Bacteroides sp. BFG-551]|nr:YesU family protein [Bacteroides sp. BFG-551]
MGGHFNVWNRRIRTSDNFAIEFDFTPLSPAPLHMLMFCGSGLEGESVFDASLPARYGVEDETMYDMAMYRVSFFHKSRRKANLRRAPGKIMVAQGADVVVSEDWTTTSRCRVERIDGTVRFLINGKERFSFKDEQPLKGDNWGFRLMACAKGAYDNIKVLTIK